MKISLRKTLGVKSSNMFKLRLKSIAPVLEEIDPYHNKVFYEREETKYERLWVIENISRDLLNSKYLTHLVNTKGDIVTKNTWISKQSDLRTLFYKGEYKLIGTIHELRAGKKY